MGESSHFQLLEAPHPWFAASPSFLPASSATSSIPVTVTLPSTSYDTGPPPWVVQGHSHSKVLNLSAEPLLPCEVPFPQAPGLGLGCLWGHYLASPGPSGL